MLCAFAVSVFAQDSGKQYEYKVSITLQNNRTHEKITEDVFVWVSTQAEARAEAEAACGWKFPGYSVITCGFPVATGKSR
jgi:hypothetical protein